MKPFNCIHPIQTVAANWNAIAPAGYFGCNKSFISFNLVEKVKYWITRQRGCEQEIGLVGQLHLFKIEKAGLAYTSYPIQARGGQLFPRDVRSGI